MINHTHRYSSVSAPYDKKCMRGHWHRIEEGNGFDVCYCGDIRGDFPYPCPEYEILTNLAYTLCQHAQYWGYDHGANLPLDIMINTCNRHLTMAAEIIKDSKV